MKENKGNADIFSTMGKVKPKPEQKPKPLAELIPDSDSLSEKELAKLQREYLWTCPDCWTQI